MKKNILAVFTTLAGVVAGAAVVKRASGETQNKIQMMSDKHLALFLMMNRWVQVKQEGKSMAAYFERHNYKTIAIYGMSYAGERLLEELKGNGITVDYGIDKDADAICADFDMVFPDDNLKEVDAVIVTPIFFIDEIEEILSKKLSCPIISLEDILYDM